jgi:phosphatidylserine decarboxylase
MAAGSRWRGSDGIMPSDVSRVRHQMLIETLRLLPRNLLSRCAGHVAAMQLPRSLRAPALRLFGRAVGVDFDEVPAPLESYASLQDFFTRALPPDRRPVDPAPDALVSPCDGSWGVSGTIHDGLALQLKGHPYRLAELLADAATARVYDGGQFATLYLSPRDYHRFHAPADLEIERAVHVPGSLWPVNRAGLEQVDALFTHNERICIHARSASGPVCFVAVGATLVGKIHVCFDGALTTNTRRREPSERRYSETRVARGAELGRFEFGSTIVLLLSAEVGALEAAPESSPLRVGRRIGRLANAEAEVSG